MFAIALVRLIESVLLVFFLGIMVVVGLLVWHGWLRPPGWVWWVWLLFAAVPVIDAMEGVLEDKAACTDDQIP